MAILVLVVLLGAFVGLGLGIYAVSSDKREKIEWYEERGIEHNLKK